MSKPSLARLSLIAATLFAAVFWTRVSTADLKIVSPEKTVADLSNQIAREKADFMRLHPELQKINVVIGGDENVESESGVGYEIKRIQRFMGGPLYYERVKGPKDISRMLTAAPRETIQSVFVLGIHGANDDGHPVFAMTPNDAGFELKDIRPRGEPAFMPGATLVFDSCELIPDPKNPKAAVKSFEEIARGLGMKSGWIYANYSDGTDMLETDIGSQLGEGTPAAQKRRLYFKLTAPVTLPEAIVYDDFIYNRGYWFGFSEMTGRHVLIKTHYRRAKRGLVEGLLLEVQ